MGLFLISLLSYGCNYSIAIDSPTVDARQPQQAGKTLEPLSVAWKNTYGVAGQDEAYSIIPVSDGYVMAGYANRQLYLVKADQNGNKVWSRLYDDSVLMKARSIVAVGDGYVVAGFISPTINSGPYSVYLMKTDLDGNKLWDRTYQKNVDGKPVSSLGEALIAVDDGYVIVGEAHSDIYGNTDVYLIKTDTNGNLVWDRTYGDLQTNWGNSIVKADDGYVIGGYTQGFHDSGRGYDITSGDILLMKTDFQGNLLWNRSFGGLYQEDEYSLIAVDDGYVIAGDTSTYSDGNMSDFDVYLVKTDLNGNMAWSNHYGGPGNEQGRAVIPVQYGYVVAGYTTSYGGRIASIYLMKADLDGNVVWNKTYIAPDMDEANAMALANDGGYVIAGFSCTNGIYTADTYLLKVAPEAAPTPMPTMGPEPATSPIPTAKTTDTPTELTTWDIAVLCGIVIVLLAIITLAAVAGYYLLKK